MKGAIWCSSISKGNIELEKIIKDYARDGIKPIENRGYKKTYFGNNVTFDNGDFWKVIPARESARGYCVNISYIDSEIDKDTVNTVIIPATRSYPFQGYKYY
jgi:hypothetical protein